MSSENGTKAKQDFVYANKIKTKIMLEKASQDNAYVTEKRYLYGYDNEELVSKRSFVDVFILLFKGELPTREEANLLEKLMIGLINPGPRHPAVKASMVAGVSKANIEHLLPIGLSVLGGESNGAKEVLLAMKFIKKNVSNSTTEVVKSIRVESSDEGDFHPFPGFGSCYGGRDIYSNNLIVQLLEQTDIDNSAGYLRWANQLSQELKKSNMGVLTTGLAAAVFLEIGIPNREAVGLFQIICAPGVFTQGAEQTHLPITAMPMLDDEQYIFDPTIKKAE